MDLDLTGRSVTQALSIFSEALADCLDPQLNIKTDNEVVKLNLYNLIHKKGMRCKMDRVGRTYVFTVETGRTGKDGKRSAPPAQTAFPVGHVSGNSDAQPSRRSRRARVKHPEPTSPGHPAPKPTAATATPSASQAQGHWLVIQQDQIGQKDVALGVELLEAFLENVEASRTDGIFLTHRGVRLLDNTYQNGKLLRALMARKVKVMACAKSLAYYQLMDHIPPSVEVAPIKELHKLASNARITWV